LEFYKLLNDGAGFETHLPIAIDGASNGTQILSILAKDQALATETNVADNDKPQDLYKAVADKALELILNRIEELSVSEQALLDELNIDRTATKKTVMCYPYSLSRFGAFEYIKAWYVEKVKELKGNYTDKEKFKVLTVLQEEIWNAVLSVQGASVKVMQFFQECAQAAMEADLEEVTWSTPIGNNKIYQHYKKVDANTVRTHVLGKTYVSTVIKDTNIVDKRRNLNGISPNVIHSIDADCLHTAVALAHEQGVINFAVVHDSFGCSAVELETLHKCVKQAYHQMAQTNYLVKFRECIREQVGPEVKLPKIPELGTFDINEIQKSTYMFS
jgi:DNA-directed RNA polymerase